MDERETRFRKDPKALLDLIADREVLPSDRWPDFERTRDVLEERLRAIAEGLGQRDCWRPASFDRVVETCRRYFTVSEIRTALDLTEEHARSSAPGYFLTVLKDLASRGPARHIGPELFGEHTGAPLDDMSPPASSQASEPVVCEEVTMSRRSPGCSPDDLGPENFEAPDDEVARWEEMREGLIDDLKLGETTAAMLEGLWCHRCDDERCKLFGLDVFEVAWLIDNHLERLGRDLGVELHIETFEQLRAKAGPPQLASPARSTSSRARHGESCGTSVIDRVDGRGRWPRPASAVAYPIDASQRIEPRLLEALAIVAGLSLSEEFLAHLAHHWSAEQLRAAFEGAPTRAELVDRLERAACGERIVELTSCRAARQAHLPLHR